MRLPRSVMDTIGPDAIAAAAKPAPLQAEYGQTIDRDSAYERLQAKLAPPPEATPPQAPPPAEAGVANLRSSRGEEGGRAGHGAGSPGELGVQEHFRSAATAAGREITRSILGTRTRRR